MVESTPMARLSDLEVIRRVIALYGQLLDDHRFEEWGALFTEDAEFASIPGAHLPGGGTAAAAVFRGRAAIVAAISDVQKRIWKEQPVIHFGGNPVIDVDGEHAKAWWDFLVMYLKPGGTEIAHAGRYYADLVKQDGRWLFRRRLSVRPGHAAPDGVAPVPGR